MKIDEAREKVLALDIASVKAKTHVYELNRALGIYLGIARRIGGEDITWILSTFQRGILITETFYRSMMLAMAVGGPFGVAIGIGGTILTGLMLADSMELRRPTY